MSEPFEISEYAAYLRRRWAFFAIACAAAASIALIASLLMPKRYTATVSIVIEPGSSRSGSVVSPVYLESLKMYETFASSDVIFENALSRFQLRGPGSPPAESMKKRILKVEKLRDTRILEISATLPDPRQALEFARYIAAGTIQLNETVTGGASRESLKSAEQESATAQAALDNAQAAWAKFPERDSIDGLQEELAGLSVLKERTRRDLNVAEVEASAEAKTRVLAKQLADAQREFDAKSTALARISSRRDVLEGNVDSARKIYEATEIKLRDLRSAEGLDSDRLKIVDNGTVPSRPSSPKTLRNIEAAVLLALIASAIFLSFSYTSRRRSPETETRYRLRA